MAVSLCGTEALLALKEALDHYSSHSRPRQLGALVDYLLQQYRPWSVREKAASGPRGILSCPGCHGLLREPVAAQCGHTYCWSCLRGEPRNQCRLCRGDMGRQPRRTCVLLKQLIHKWFPLPGGCSGLDRDVTELLRAGKHREALNKIHKALEADPQNLTLRVYRAESYAALCEFGKAHEELDFVLSKQRNNPEVYFKKAKMLQDTGHMYESLIFYLQCLALDEEFALARCEMEKILHDFLSPVPENVEGILKDLERTSLPNTPLKPFVLGSDKEEPSYSLPRCLEQGTQMPKSMSTIGTSVMQRTQSVHALGAAKISAREEGLKRVSSEPLLSSQENGILLKRKFSLFEQDANVCEDGQNKHIKHGVLESEVHTLPPEWTMPDGIDTADFECSLCMRLFYEPVTTPCGHTFCKKCLERCLDHTPQCPLCKESLTEYLASRNYNMTYLLEELIKKYLPEELSERKKIHEEETDELSNLTKNVPMFVCTMAYPTVPCPLHVFEPRYRLMIRRCMETGTKQFGMCISDPEKSFADYGCMLQIRNVHFLPDGRSVVDTIGGKRFRVLKRGMRDGYYTADIEYLTDSQVEEEELEQLKQLHDAVYAQACRWFQNLRYRFRSQILHHFGSMPERESNIQGIPNGPAWCWWLLAVLPVDPRYQLSVLSMASLKDRLLKIQHILTYFSRDQPK
ncbi:LON peptidase N-terminal domain and RING finger protein 1 isoform X2 [Spea bombifrons]|uniref:LON peptidase N-terminal domain and RING finger protein 1 isoform X2 n=1 Tax=Spea bombifrons TaxID=233779 RepID=UPI00234B9732|nr:LON peptidase N-terminal domain and RING finger protein 1 isoform X2 [Spea bombifrons]